MQDKIYGLALRMLWHPEDAQDATQEILIRVITHLGSFRRESRFTTWVYRIAANYLSTARQSRLEAEQYTFTRFGAELDQGLSDVEDANATTPDRALLLEEIKIGCTLGMLLCLDRAHRLAYILGEIMELDHREAATILNITPAAFRKQLSRARTKITDFTQWKCGLVNSSNPCRCSRRVSNAVQAGWVNSSRLLFATDQEQAIGFPVVLSKIRKLEEARRAAALYQSHPPGQVMESFVDFVRKLIGEEAI